ncbi:ABC-three component system protein [Clostridium chromiireducens]|nr:ABC-three component system protein [Clostridium chromiireducens]
MLVLQQPPSSQVEKMRVEGKLSFRGRIEKYTENFKEILMRIDPEDMNIVRDSQKKMAGCSGAGVFIQNHTSIQLAGILTDVGDEENQFNILNATKIEEIERFIADMELIPIDYMRDKKILDFKDSCFKELRKDELKESLKDYIDEFTDLKIVDIIDWLGEKVIFPCIGEKYNDYNLWTSWCEFIALMVIYSDFGYGDTVEELLDYLKDHRDNHTKFYYSYVSELADIVREIYSDKFHDTIYTKCKQNNNILVDFKADKFAITYLKSDKVSKIVRSISTVNCTKKNRITNPEVNKNLNFIHMDLLRERISKECSFIDNKDDIKETVSTIVREVFNNVGNR